MILLEIGFNLKNRVNPLENLLFREMTKIFGQPNKPKAFICHINPKIYMLGFIYARIVYMEKGEQKCQNFFQNNVGDYDALPSP